MRKSQFKPLLTLAVSHDIHLTAEQRMSLALGDSVDAVGVSVPVWYSKGNTTEPGREVFCNYKIHNKHSLADQVFFRTDGYEFNLPQISETPEDFDPEEWSDLDAGERAELLEGGIVTGIGNDLLDPREGGKGRLDFSKSAKAKMRGIPTVVHHTIKIGSVESLLETLV